jgi:hypothetical protein
MMKCLQRGFQGFSKEEVERTRSATDAIIKEKRALIQRVEEASVSSDADSLAQLFDQVLFVDGEHLIR